MHPTFETNDTFTGVSELYRQALRIRKFEECVSRLLADGTLGGTTHLCIGQEAVPVGVSSRLWPHDQVVSNHRGHGHLLAKGGAAAPFLAELAGKETGYCRGKGGSQHIAAPDIGFMGSNGITAGGIPIAVGLALAAKTKKDDTCVVVYLGDGACSTGNFHESLNLAALWRLPIVFVCENNLYAMSNPIEASLATDSPSDWAKRYRGMNTGQADGQDAEDVAKEFGKLATRARLGEPGFLTCNTYRFCGHSRSDPRNYRHRDEEKRWKKRCPIAILRAKVVVEENEEQALRIETLVDKEIQIAETFALSSPTASSTVATSGAVLPCGEEPENPHSERRAPQTPHKKWTMRQAIAETISGAIKSDQRVVFMGEDIGTYGGAFGVSRGMLETFDKGRVIQTPIAENSFVGATVGAAMGGLRPIVEIMFADFTTCCMDALVNHAAKIRYMYDGLLHVPMVLRAPMGRRFGYGATHSQSPEAFFLHVPGLKVVAPSSANAAAALLEAAIKDPDPVLFFEHKLLYDQEEVSDWQHPAVLGKARRITRGQDITIISYAHGILLVKKAAQFLAHAGIGAEVIDLQTLAPLDKATCIQSVAKTGRLLLVSEDTDRGGVASIVEADLSAHIFNYLQAPITRISAPDVPIPAGRELEEAASIHAKDIFEVAKHLVEAY